MSDLLGMLIVEEGTVITRTALSTLPETSSLESGLNRTVVGGNWCASSIEVTGYKYFKLFLPH